MEDGTGHDLRSTSAGVLYIKYYIYILKGKIYIAFRQADKRSHKE